jgi:hypothetical protein
VNAWWSSDARLGGLRRFATAISALTLLGHAWLGFEQAWLHPIVALAATYGTELALEFVDARAHGRAPAFVRQNRVAPLALLDFLLPAHITGLAIAMLLYPGRRLEPIVFAAVVAIASKALVRVRVEGRARHVLNPSNLGITATLLCFPSVGIAPPYQFSEGTGQLGDWLFPTIVIALGTFLNTRFTRRLPLIGAWLAGFVLQALARSLLGGSLFLPALMPMTGLAFLLFTFYMVTDPPTTPSSVRGQIAFGASVAACYGLLIANHIVFDLFFALTITCVLHGVVLFVRSKRTRAQPEPAQPIEVPLASASVEKGLRHARV